MADRAWRFTGFSGAYARPLSIEKNSIWDYPIGNSVLPTRGRPVHLVEGAYGACVRCSGRLKGECLRGADDFGKKSTRRRHKNFAEFFLK